MKIDSLRKFFSFVILLLCISSVSLKATSTLPLISDTSTPPNAIYQKMFNDLMEVDHCKFTTPIIKKPAFKVASYDPHSQLIFEPQLEAGRIVLNLDAYYGQDLKMEIQNESGDSMVNLSRKSVKLNYLQVDLAAWDCGTYYILLMNDHGEVEQHKFVID